MYLVEKYTKRGQTNFQDKIFFEITNPRTYASYLLLKQYYNSIEDKMSRYENRVEWIRFSRLYLTQILDAEGTLKCSYCPKKDLIIEYEGMIVKPAQKASIDHIHATSEGGEQYDINNMCVSCGTCNAKKSNKPLEDFLKNIRKKL